MCDIERTKAFYDKAFCQDWYAVESIKKHSVSAQLKDFINRYNLYNKRCLEIGCGRGIFQDLVEDYTGVDLSDSVWQYLHKPFYQSLATELPFKENEFDAIWTIYALEHVHDPEKALYEMHRVLKPGGLLFFHPAWFCEPWYADGYSVRPYKDFDLKGKMIKASLLIRNNVHFRRLRVLPARLLKYLCYIFKNQPDKFRYKQLRPNYIHYWQADSDAVNSIDPLDAIIWFVSRGDTCLSHPTPLSWLVARRNAIIFKKTSNENQCMGGSDPKISYDIRKKGLEHGL